MRYITDFCFPSQNTEKEYLENFFKDRMPKYREIYYPFQVLSEIGLSKIQFSDITILYGGNGAGKSTALHIISQKLKAKNADCDHSNTINEAYTDLCTFDFAAPNGYEEASNLGTSQSHWDIGKITTMITSEDISDIVCEERNRRVHDYLETIKRLDCVSILSKELPSISNSVNSSSYIYRLLRSDGLYLIDEPENSLSPELQMELAEQIFHTAKNGNSQFIIASNSPYLLGIPGVRIYNLDERPACESKFEDLPAMHDYYKFFSEKKTLFEGKSGN